MQYIYTECQLPSNGMFYPIKTVHLRPKTIFDIKTLLNNPVYMIKSEIDALQNCIDPNDKIDVYDLCNQDIVFLLYKLRSMSDDCLNLNIKNKQYSVKISELEVKYLESWNNVVTLPESGIVVNLAYKPIKNIFNIDSMVNAFLTKYPEYKGDATNAVTLLNAIERMGEFVSKDHIRAALEELSWKDSLYLIDAIEKQNNLDFGIKEEVELEIDGENVTVPLTITEAFFRSAL